MMNDKERYERPCLRKHTNARAQRRYQNELARRAMVAVEPPDADELREREFQDLACDMYERSLERELDEDLYGYDDTADDVMFHEYDLECAQR